MIQLDLCQQHADTAKKENVKLSATAPLCSKYEKQSKQKQKKIFRVDQRQTISYSEDPTGKVKL